MSRLYEIAAKLAPTVVLLQNVDLVIGDRHDATSTALSEFLETVDGPATPQVGIITIATTNNPSAIDPAAWREARLARRQSTSDARQRGTVPLTPHTSTRNPDVGGFRDRGGDWIRPGGDSPGDSRGESQDRPTSRTCTRSPVCSTT